MKDDLISVIIPAYNSENYIQECLNLLMKQTYDNLEILVINDGSKDNTEKIIKDVMKTDKRIRYFYQSNQGQSCARNLGLKHVQGKYIVFIDSDDIFEVDLIEELYNRITADNLDMSIAMLDYYKANEILYRNKGVLNANKIINNIDVIKLMLCCNEIRFHPVCKMFRREIFNELEFPVGKIYEDVITIFWATLKATRIGYVNKVLYHYKINDNSTTHNNRFSSKRFQLYKYALEMETILKEYFPHENFCKEIAAFKVDAYLTLKQGIKKIKDLSERETYLLQLEGYRQSIMLKDILITNKISIKKKITFIWYYFL